MKLRRIPEVVLWLLLLILGVAWAVPSGESPAAHAASPTNPKLLIGVLVDTHPRPNNVIDVERQVVDSLMSGLVGVPANGFFSTYSDRVRTIAEWSPVDPGLRQASARITLDDSVKHPGAALYDGVMAALAKLTSASEADRRVLIVIGEGNDGASVTKASRVLDTAKRQRVQCFVVLVATHRSQVGRVRQYGVELYRLASGTRGKFYDIRTDRRLLDKAVRDVLNRLGVAPQPVSQPTTD
jgi:hypothetical protein